MKAEKSKRNFWLTSEIECMLSLIKQMQRMQGTTATTHFTFVQIANKMRKRGFPNKSPTQIRRKWFQMKSAYLCFKRGNVERLLLIPEKFRSVIAQFVDAESNDDTSQISENLDSILRAQESSDQSQADYRKSAGDVLQRYKEVHKNLNKEFLQYQQSLLLCEQNFQAMRDAALATFIRKSIYVK